jgi:hypothetical protein
MVDSGLKGDLMTDTTFEMHYRISDLVSQWGLGRETLRKLLQNEPGVVKVRLGEKKKNTTYYVPQSVAQRVHTKLLNPALGRACLNAPVA